MNIQAAILPLILIALFDCKSQTNNAMQEGATSASFKSIEEVSEALSKELQHEYENGTFEGSIIITSKGGLLLKKSYGWSDRKRKIKNSSDSISDIGSIAKTFTAAAILQLVASERLKLDSTLQEFFPNIPKNKKNIKIRSLLTHSSGMDNFHAETDFDVMSKEEAISKIIAMPLIFTPNEKVVYSNAAYTLLAAIVEIRTEQPFQQYVHDNLLAPLSLADTGFYGDENISKTRLSKGYGGIDSGSTTFEKGLTWALLGAGGMAASVNDLHKWFRALLDGKVLPNDSKNLVLLTANQKWKLGSIQYSKSWGAFMLFMGGSTDYGYTAAILYLPEYDVTIVMMLNTYSDKYAQATHHKLSKNHIFPILIKGASVLQLPNG